MQPIFKELINMWSDLGYGIPITEGKFWLDNNIIKAYTHDGKLHNLYRYKVYDDLSIVITSHRVGCGIACPYATKYTWVLDKYWYPEMRTRWEKVAQEVFLRNQRWTQMNCTLAEYIKDGWNGTLYRPEPTDEVVNEFMEYKGITDRNVALQYFNKTCCECGKNVRQNDTLAMNLKMIGRNTNKVYCKKCLMEHLVMSKEEYDNNVADFKSQGCKLF